MGAYDGPRSSGQYGLYRRGGACWSDASDEKKPPGGLHSDKVCRPEELRRLQDIRQYGQLREVRNGLCQKAYIWDFEVHR